MSKNRDIRESVFGVWWLAANAISWGIFFIINILVRYVVAGFNRGILFRFFPLIRLDFVGGMLLVAGLGGLIWGGIVGGLQRLVLGRRLLQKGKWWILATWVGLLPFTLYLFIYQSFITNPAYPDNSLAHLTNLFRIAAVVAPLWFGLAQWLVLRRTFSRSAWWIAAAALAVGLVTFSFTSQNLFLLVFRPHHAYLLLAPVGMGLLYASLTWIVLAFLPLRSQVKLEKEVSPAG